MKKGIDVCSLQVGQQVTVRTGDGAFRSVVRRADGRGYAMLEADGGAIVELVGGAVFVVGRKALVRVCERCGRDVRHGQRVCAACKALAWEVV